MTWKVQGRIITTVAILVVSAILPPIMDRYFKETLQEVILGVLIAVLGFVTVDLRYYLRSRAHAYERVIQEAERAVVSRIEATEARFSERLHSIDFDPRLLSEFQKTALTLVGATSGIDFVLHFWFLKRIQKAFDSRFYRTHMGDDEREDGKGARKTDEDARMAFLTKIVLNAETVVRASTYADADHIEDFWGCSWADAYIRAHGDALRRKPNPPVMQRVFIVPESLSKELKERLLDIILALFFEGMLENYWVSESNARQAFKNTNKLRFPDRGFFLADDVFVSEGWSNDETLPMEVRRPHFTYSKRPSLFAEVGEQFLILLQEAQRRNGRLDTLSAVESFAKAHLGISEIYFRAALNKIPPRT